MKKNNLRIRYSLIWAMAFLLVLQACGSKTQNNQSTSKSLSAEAIKVDNLFPDKGLTDAHSIIVNDKLYVFCGHDKSWDTEDTWMMDRWEIWSTNNLTDWKKESEIHPKDTYIGDVPNCFAGDITERNGKYYWYFSNRNLSTGVMVADSPVGPFKDALRKPLLPKGIIGKLHPYDPEIFVEDGVYYIIFGAGHYHIATLADDMISLADEPKPIKVLDEKGNDMWTADKACMFKRNDKYYLIWEHKYAMSENLQGPYTFIGESLKGGHCNVFNWNGQHYMLLENKDISLFYRGVSLKPLNFNDDGTLIVPKSDSGFPANGRAWNFEQSRMAWRAIQGTNLNWNDAGKIVGELTGNGIIESAPWLLTDMEKHQTLRIRIKNKSDASQAKIAIATLNPKGRFWKNTEINWDQEAHVFIELEKQSDAFKEYTVDLSKLQNLEPMLQKLRIQPAVGVSKGTWEIEFISVE